MGTKRKRNQKEVAPARGAKNNKASPLSPPPPPATPRFETKPFVETPTGPERKRVAELYDLLGSEDENDRLQVAECVLLSLLSEPVPEVVLQRHLENRLLRGLASGRNASRPGFSLVITEILHELFVNGLSQKHYSGLSFDQLLACLEEKTHVAAGLTSQEDRDHHIGRLFGIQCFVRSNAAFQDNSRWHALLQSLLNLAYKKVWLRPACGMVVVEAIAHLSEESVESTLKTIAEAGLSKTAEGVAIWLTALGRFPSLSVDPWQHPLSKKSLTNLAAVLKESGVSGDSQTASQQANRSSQPHYVWDIILAHFLQGEDKPKDNTKDFELFWTRVANDGLFSKNATDGQKFKGFMVFQQYLTNLVGYPSKLESLFTKNFMICLINQAANKDRYLHRAAIGALKALENTVSEHPDIVVPVLRNLISRNGVYNFDQKTNTKTVDKLLQSVNETSGAACLEIIQTPLAKLGQQGSQEAQLVLRTYVDYLSKTLVATASSASENTSSTTKPTSGVALQELSGLAYSQPKHIPESLLTDRLRELSRSRLETSLAKLIRQGKDFTLLCNAVLSMDTKFVTMEDEIVVVMGEARTRLRKLLERRSESDVEKSLTRGLAMLHAVSIFQLYNEDPDAVEVLRDLAEVSKRLKKGKLENDEGSSEVLIEILLSIVTRPSSLMRQVSQQVFETFTSQVSAEGLELLTGPLGSDESAKGQQELFNTEDDEMLVDEDEDGDEEDEEDSNVVDLDEASDFEMDSDVEFVNLKQDGDDGESSDNDDDDDDDDDDDGEKDGEGKKDGPLDLEELIGNILNSHRLDKDAEAESSEDDGDMTDSEMLALDEKLAEVIRPHVKSGNDSKKQKKDAKQSVVNFKHRILDLLKIYIKNEVTNPLSINVLVPLVKLIRTSSTLAMANQASDIIHQYQKALKKARGNKQKVEGLSTEKLLDILNQVHEEAGKHNSHAHAKAASASSLILASLILSVDENLLEEVINVYSKTQLQRVLGHSIMQRSFIDDWNNWLLSRKPQS